VGWIAYYIDFEVLPWSTNDAQIQMLWSFINGVLAGIVAWIVVIVIAYYWARRKAEEDSS
jgi:TRAP-type C4-dicarboxylate transport system permease large subunit